MKMPPKPVKTQTLMFDQPLAADVTLALDICFNMIECFEGYIAKTGREVKSQFYGTGRSIKDYSGTVDQLQTALVTHMEVCALTFNEKKNPEINYPIKKMAQDNFYRWICLSGIPMDRDVCHYLIELHDNLEGKYDNVVRQEPPEANKPPTIENVTNVFSEHNTQVNRAMDIRKSFDNKPLDQATFQQVGGGKEECEKGKEIFKQIEDKYRWEHKSYYLYTPFEQAVGGNPQNISLVDDPKDNNKYSMDYYWKTDNTKTYLKAFFATSFLVSIFYYLFKKLRGF